MRIHLRFLAVALAAMALLAAGAAGAQDPAKVEIKTVPVAGNISVLAGAGGNIGVSAGEDGVLLIDDGILQVVDKVKTAVTALHPGRVRFVLNTNWHGDHANGNELFARADAVVIAHENSRRRMESGQAYPELGPGATLPPYPKEALPVITVGDALTLYFNGDEVRMVHVPDAHSEGDLVFRFAKANVIQAGDVFFSGGFPFIHVSGGGTIAGMIKAQDVLLGMCDERTKVIPGHGPVSDRAVVRAFKELLVASRDRIAGLVKSGKSLEQILAARPVDGLYRGGESMISPETFVKVVHADLTGKYRKR